jgi:dipeptidyl-peptidase-4
MPVTQVSLTATQDDATGCQTRAMQTESFPRQAARTRGFTAGAPRLFSVSPDGGRVLFVRSSSGTDATGRLWALDTATGEERLVADPTALHQGAEDLSPEERARRERMREGNAGIVGYATDREATVATFALSGGLYAVGLGAGDAVRSLDVPGPVIDPRPSPDGRLIAYVSGRSLRVVGADGSGDRAVAEPAHELETCGLVDFIAAEELGRSRGFWWSPDASMLLVERVDETPVQEWWIADPVHPDQAPRPHRYPAAGTANADVTLELVALDGATMPVEWDHDRYPYLVDVAWQPGRDALLVVMTREQKDQAVLAVHPLTGATTVVAEIHDDAWVDATPGATRWSPAGELLTLRADPSSDTYRLHLGDRWLSPERLQIRGVVEADDDGVLVATAPDPMLAALAVIRWDGSVVLVGPQDGWTIGRRAGGTSVLVSRTLDSLDVAIRVTTATASYDVASHAEQPEVTPAVTILEAGERGIRTAVLFPRDHVPGSRRLPVLLSPYGGPHHQEVVAVARLYGEDQWLADQGFCVVVADGRGTPGRGPSFERAVYRDYATPVLDDQVAALDAVLARWPDDTDGERVGIRGWSFGGFLAALAVLRRPDRFHAAVAGAPVTVQRLYDTAYTERYLGHPDTDPEPYRICSLIDDAPTLRRPLLIMHGLTDDNVVVAHTLALSAALTAAGRPHQVLPLSGVTHMTPQVEVAENKLLLELDFLKRALT